MWDMAQVHAKPSSPKAAAISDGTISTKLLDSFRRDFESDAHSRQSMNAVTVTPVNKVALDRRRAATIDHSFSHHLSENKATAQNSSGRCWMFAALNTFRVRAIAAMSLADDWELSQNYICFWDKLEKANYFLENILTTLDEPVGSRLLDYLLASPIQDGGQWHMFIGLIKKYGVVPKSVMPETESSSSTGQMNQQVTAKLREFACRLREDSSVGEDGRMEGRKGGGNGTSTSPSFRSSTLRKLKEQMLSEIYRMLCIHLGEPPTEFDWQWRDKDKGFHRRGPITSKQFYEEFVGIDLDDMVCLIHDPRPFHKFNEVYTVKFLGNVAGGEPVLYLNVDLDTMKRAAVEQIKSGEPVWFGCDVGKFMDRDLGVMDQDLFDFGLVYGLADAQQSILNPKSQRSRQRAIEDRDNIQTRSGLDKAERLMYCHSSMNHAMVFTGVDLDDSGSSRKWRVENSWSDKPGDKGFFQMSDAWFDEYNYEAVVHRKFVPASSLAALKRKPVELPPWDPMGSLA